MTRSLVRSGYWPFMVDPGWDEFDLSLGEPSHSGLSLSEDDKYVYVRAALPGVDPEKVELTFDKGVLWIKGEKEEEDKGRKYYRRSANSFSYRVNVPGEIDPEAEPVAECEHGICEVRFAKKPQAKPKKIAVKAKKKK